MMKEGKKSKMEGTDFESLFKVLHSLKMKLDSQLKTWSWLRWIFFFLPVGILATTVVLSFSTDELVNTILIAIITILWLLFTILCAYVYRILNNQAKVQVLFAKGKGDEDIPGMSWELFKLWKRARNGKMLLIITVITFLVFVGSYILAYILPVFLTQELDDLAPLLSLSSSVAGFLVLISLGMIIYRFDLFLNMSEIRGDYYPKDTHFHSHLGPLEFVESYIRPSAREDFRNFREGLVKSAGEQGELFLGQFTGLVYLFLKQRLVENWGAPKFALDYQKLVENIVQVFPREPFMQNLQIFTNMAQKRMRLDIVSQLSSVQRIGTLNDDRLREIIIPLLQIEPEGDFIQAYRKCLEIPAFDRMMGRFFLEVNRTTRSLQCLFEASSDIDLNKTGSLQVLVINNTQEDRSLTVNITCTGLSPEELIWDLQGKKGRFLDQLPSEEFQQLFFTTKSGKDLRTAAGIFSTNSQGFWVQLHPQRVGKCDLKATVTDMETGELVGSFQTTIAVKRNLLETAKMITGLVTIVVGPLLSVIRLATGEITGQQ
ncbi:MAG: hypothetical protein ACFFD4_15800 [Candidatus Odinarchaeota archaeon]